MAGPSQNKDNTTQSGKASCGRGEVTSGEGPFLLVEFLEDPEPNLNLERVIHI